MIECAFLSQRVTLIKVEISKGRMGRWASSTSGSKCRKAFPVKAGRNLGAGPFLTFPE